MPRSVTIRSLPQAFAVIKEMEGEGHEWGEDTRAAARDVLTEILKERMVEARDRHLEEKAARTAAE